ncbi:MAG: signal recognition particle-docking protein FtsY, partial [Solirubrobacteraceae bacterium]
AAAEAQAAELARLAAEAPAVPVADRGADALARDAERARLAMVESLARVEEVARADPAAPAEADAAQRRRFPPRR